MNFITKEGGAYVYVWRTVDSSGFVLFKVQSCEAVNIALSRYNLITDIQTYEVTIGAQQNSMTIIKNRIGGNTMAQA